MKGAQVGGTTWAILRAIHACLNGLNTIYYFPTKTDVLDFSKSRVGPLLGDNPFLANMMNDTDTAGLKRIGNAHLYLRGMQSTVGMKSVPADMLVFDELDEATPQAKAMAKERLAHSKFRRLIELSNPSFPDFGIDEAYQLSDQRHWTVKCPSCGGWVSLDKEFPMTLNQQVKVILPGPDGSFYRACTKCQAALDLAVGEWVADFPNRPIHGYRISHLISARVDAGDILNEYKITRYPDSFYNLKIGVPYSDLHRRLDMASVLSLCTEREMLDKSEEHCIMGVDTGKALHAVILREADTDDYDHYDLVHLAVCREFSDLDELMKRFKVETCVIDGLPETHATREFAGRHHGKVFLSFFNENQRGEPNWDLAGHKIESNRTEALDASRAAVRDKLITLPRRLPMVETFARHMAADAKKLEEDPDTGVQKYRYMKTGENHFSFAFTYAMLASRDIRGGRALLRVMRRRVRQLRREGKLPPK